MHLKDFISLDLVKLELKGTSRDEILKGLVSLLDLDEKSGETLFERLRRLQELGSTGIGRGIAVVYTRSHVITRVRVGFGRKRDGIDFEAIDGKPVHYFFLIVSPPVEESNQFLPILGKTSRLAKEPDVPDRLRRLERPEEFLELLEEEVF
jgi:mannitol/fructose-specific phosphotransferase system IIA component (Ntr-type)